MLTAETQCVHHASFQGFLPKGKPSCDSILKCWTYREKSSPAEANGVHLFLGCFSIECLLCCYQFISAGFNYQKIMEHLTNTATDHILKPETYLREAEPGHGDYLSTTGFCTCPTGKVMSELESWLVFQRIKIHWEKILSS